jgi:hypothetical protein
MTSDRKKAGVAFWATVVVVVALVAYPLSFGPACWWFAEREPMPPSSPRFFFAGTLTSLLPVAPRFYWPIGWIAMHGPTPANRLICWYATLRRDELRLPCESSGKACVWASRTR